MKVCCVISVFVCSLLVVAADDNDKVEVEILSGQTDDCEKAADGDHLSIQYTGTLADTGKIFDSRYLSGMGDIHIFATYTDHSPGHIIIIHSTELLY